MPFGTISFISPTDHSDLTDQSLLMDQVAKTNAKAALQRLPTTKYVKEVENIVKESLKLRMDRIDVGEKPKMIKDNRKLRQICLARMSQ